MTSKLNKIKECASDPYDNQKNYLITKIRVKSYQNRDYTVLTYKKSHGLG